MEAKGILLSYSLKDKTGAWLQPKPLPNVEVPGPLLSQPLIANQIANQEAFSLDLDFKESPHWRKLYSAVSRGYYPFESLISRRRKRLSYKAGCLEER